MKTLRSTIVFIWAFIVVFTLNTCKEVVPVDHQNSTLSIKYRTLDISEQEIYFPTANSSSTTFSVVSTNVDWEIIDIPEWLTVSPNTGGDGSTQVTVSASENTHPTNRVGILSFKVKDKSWSYDKTVTVSQTRGKMYAIPEKTRVEFDGSASSSLVLVDSNIDDWTIYKNTTFDWCTVTKTETGINITVTPNTSDIARECQIYIYTSDGAEYFTVVQRPANISTTTQRLDFTVSGGTLSIQINSEAPWTALTSYSWINVTPESGEAGETTITVAVTPNNSLTPRYGYIYIVLSDASKIEVPVSQGNITFNIDNTEIIAPADGQDYHLSLESNVDWKVLDDIPTWITFDPLSGTNDDQIILSVKSNPSYNERYATIKVAPVSLTNATTEINVKQNGRSFETDSTALHFSDKSSSTYFKIESDGNWTVTSGAAWITIDKESGTGNALINVSVTENTTDSVRIGYILASIEGKQIMVNVYQKGKYLNISSYALEFPSKGGGTQVTINTNNSWTATKKSNWISLSDSIGNGNCNITINTSDNPSANSRNGYVDIIPNGSNPIRISVKQAARYLKLSVETIRFFHKGGTSDPINIYTDGEPKVESNTEWVTINNLSENQFSITVPASGVDLMRSGLVNVSLTDLVEGAVSVPLTVIQDGVYNGYNYVDLGLSVDWATCNVGADNPEDYGDYYAWGEIEPKSTYDWSNYKWCNGNSSSLNKYNTKSSNGTVDNKQTLDLEDDIANNVLGGTWRMPTQTEFNELINNCTWTYTTLNGVNGFKVTSNKIGYTDRFIFLPAAGYRFGTTLSNEGTFGYYWSSSLYNDDPSNAYGISFGTSYTINKYNRNVGRTIRPVNPYKIQE